MNSKDITSVYTLYIHDMYSYALHLGFDENIIMDAIHDVFLNICRKERNTDEITDLKFYLFRSLKNRLLNLNRYRKKLVNFSFDINAPDSPFGINVTIDESLVTRDEHEAIRAKIEEMLSILTPRQREIIYLRYVQEYNYEQISQLMNITVPACRKLVHRAISTIREKYPLFFILLIIR